MATGSSFSSLRSYGTALTEIPTRLRSRAGSISTTTEEMSHIRARSGSHMQKNLRWFDLVGLGIGGMVGAGVFVTTGRASHSAAGPAIVVSYVISGFCALLSAFCYTEFAVDMPVAGGAFSYLRVTFGEFAAFLTGANLVMEYVLSNAAVARTFTSYFATIFGVTVTNKWRISIDILPDGYDELDFIAVGVILIISLCICYSTKESSILNIVLTLLHIVFIVMIIGVGFWKGEWKNFVKTADPSNPKQGFAPFGVSGIFQGAASVYLSYIGYDAVSTMAEEVRNPRKDIPIGVCGSVIIVTVLYCLMAASMSKLVPYDAINVDAPFSAAFQGGTVGWRWVSNFVGIGASFGILTSLLVSMLGQARYLCVIGRSNVVPRWFAKVHPKTSTPINASAFLGFVTAFIALFTDLQVLLNLVSIGTLFVFYMVANAVIYRRYVIIGTTNPWPTICYLLPFSVTAITFTLIWQQSEPGKAKTFMLGACTVISVALLQMFYFFVPQARVPDYWGVPFMPWIPSISIFLNVFLLGSLDGPSYIRFGIFSGLIVIVYLLYSVHSSFDAEENIALSQKEGELQRYEVDGDDDANTLQV